MEFKDFLLLKERAYFVDLTTLSERIINTLQEKLAKKKSIRSGDTITVPVNKNSSLDIKLYKGYSHAARAAKSNDPSSNTENEGVSAMYFPKTGESNGRIEIYVNASKKEQDYYKERKFEDFINKSLPKYIKDILRHEIAHAYEDIVSDVSQFKSQKNDTMEDYQNSDDEINAYLMQFLPGEVQVNHMVKYFVSQGDANAAVRKLLEKLAPLPWVKALTDDNKRWVVKTIYTYINKLLDK